MNHPIPRCLRRGDSLSVYIPSENGSRSTFTDVLAIENDCDSVISGLEQFNIPSATYAEFDFTYNASAKVNKYIYGEWFSKQALKEIQASQISPLIFL